MKRVVYFCLAMLVSTGAMALEAPSWPAGPVAVMPKGEYVLLGDTALEYDSISFEDGTMITTAGHDLDLLVRQSLSIKGTLTIRSFGPLDIPPKPASIAKAAGGKSYNRGPGTEGGSVAEIGAAGEPGKAGETGQHGAAGFEAAVITLRFDPSSKAAGKLVVRNEGGIGGTGGDGGDGGNGGDGQQGGRGKDGTFDCAAGPGQGGRAGDGGPGGPPGEGGDGGHGGLIVLQTSSEQVRDWLGSGEFSVAGGKPGPQGAGGKGGEPGQPGYGGRGSHHCQGKEADRMGEVGDPGKTNTSSVTAAKAGMEGRIKRLN